MLGKQHLFYGITTATALAVTFSESNLPFFHSVPLLILGSAIGSIAPDMDTPKSTIGKLVWPLSVVINKLIGHRTYTHDPALILPIAFYVVSKAPWMFGFFFGYIGHLFLDSLTAEGIPVFYLFNKRNFHLLPYSMKFYANSFVAKIATGFMTVITISGIWIAGNIDAMKILKTIAF